MEAEVGDAARSDGWRSLAKRLDESKTFRDVFRLVKRTAEQVLAERRAGLMLVLADLPLNLGAFHQVGGNSIVMNKRLMQLVENAGVSRLDLNSFVYTLLLHEYLHSLGHLDEGEVRRLVFEVSKESFGPDHQTANLALKGPWSLLPSPVKEWYLHGESSEDPREVEIVKEFDSGTERYIQ